MVNISMDKQKKSLRSGKVNCSSDNTLKTGVEMTIYTKSRVLLVRTRRSVELNGLYRTANVTRVCNHSRYTSLVLVLL